MYVRTRLNRSGLALLHPTRWMVHGGTPATTKMYVYLPQESNIFCALQKESSNGMRSLYLIKASIQSLIRDPSSPPHTLLLMQRSARRMDGCQGKGYAWKVSSERVAFLKWWEAGAAIAAETDVAQQKRTKENFTPEMKINCQRVASYLIRFPKVDNEDGVLGRPSSSELRWRRRREDATMRDYTNFPGINGQSFCNLVPFAVLLWVHLKVLQHGSPNIWRENGCRIDKFSADPTVKALSKMPTLVVAVLSQSGQ